MSESQQNYRAEGGDGFERQKIQQTRGYTVEFDGKLLADTEWQTDGGGTMALEVWETRGGALVAVTEGDRGGFLDTRALVVEPGEEFAMRCAVMDFFHWDNRARTMVRKQLGWKLKRFVD